MIDFVAMKTQVTKYVTVKAVVELSLELTWPEEAILSLIDDEEADVEEVADGLTDSDAEALLDIEHAKEELIGEFIKIKSGTYENRLCGHVVDILSVVETTDEEDGPTTTA